MVSPELLERENEAKSPRELIEERIKKLEREPQKCSKELVVDIPIGSDEDIPGLLKEYQAEGEGEDVTEKIFKYGPAYGKVEEYRTSKENICLRFFWGKKQELIAANAVLKNQEIGG